ncbi:hypothetical protein ASF39_19875 [Methylobacterium sp. Leaf108]|nr:hypothetical protein ASF39_19875 [Methylobacterium sp. Leaf108]
MALADPYRTRAIGPAELRYLQQHRTRLCATRPWCEPSGQREPQASLARIAGEYERTGDVGPGEAPDDLRA